MADWRQVLNYADVGTARLIIQLQMQDAAAIASMPAGNTADQTRRDADFARQLFEEDLKDIHGQLPDRALGEKLTVTENRREGRFEQAAFSWHFDEREKQVVQAPTTPSNKLLMCLICTDNYPEQETVEAPCSHVYCRNCLEHLFRSSMKDETLYPPRCCKQHIPIHDAHRILPRVLRDEFIDRKEELETLDKTYCFRPQCSAFIRPSTINGDRAQCPRCMRSTCTLCKSRYHSGDCEADPGYDQLLAAATENNWKRCSACRRFVELKHGCNHITCRCRHEFCYVCGEEWKTCDCPNWDEARLLERGHRVARNFMPPEDHAQGQARVHAFAGALTVVPRGAQDEGAEDQRPATMEVLARIRQRALQGRQAQHDAAMAQAVQQAVEHIRNNHECDHERFQTYRDLGQRIDCEMCGHQFRTWIPQCRQCLMLLCVRCKNNRL
ncbi:hypothetical protein BDY17DRAFT_324602 [Neohortaea acidophila]|uniref:RBR-type E3 ubiquitin transferase n=1 Tax=Neohortaea acidophila TaxID=245834 RepID=A0A6A6PRL2_9PEZI|nr:uncharacterized protein BDY17DRAFT_324602 [Neohortaea acidophila]KAF2482311.1 hypothetical protein BDY17DRAFT_324602 [Neohortaea acidophila]